ncbi:MAG: tyrosine-type recombinase/integrase, partial [Ktedonobacterales bacterium]
HVVLKDLTAQQVQKMETTLLKTKSSRGTLYSPTTVRQMHTVLKGALKDALSMHLVLENVAGAFKAPKSATKEMKYWTPAEARTFLASVRGHRLEALFTLALSTGARQGELLALTWGDVDFAKGTCSIRRTIRYVVGGGFRFTEPKTLKSKRTIKLTQATLAALKSHRARQAEERLAAGAAWQNTHDLMFTTAHGTPVLAQNLDKQFAKLVQAEGVPPIRWHDMRHTCATILLSHGANIKAVSELLGHSDIAITLRIYAHVLPNMHDQMASIMEEALFG